MPSIRVRPNDTQVAEGSQATFNCAYDDVAIVEWYAHNQDIPLTNGTRVLIWPNNSLTLNDVAKNDEGLFKCVGIPMHKGVPQQVFAARLSVACEFGISFFFFREILGVFVFRSSSAFIASESWTESRTRTWLASRVFPVSPRKPWSK